MLIKVEQLKDSFGLADEVSNEQSPWKAGSHSNGQEIHCFLSSPNVQCRVHRSPPLVPVLSRMSPAHTLPPYFPNIHFTIIFRIYFCVFQVLFPSGFRTKISYAYLISPICAIRMQLKL
jgi:hypothetical protein